jgi:hypothetical protein
MKHKALLVVAVAVIVAGLALMLGAIATPSSATPTSLPTLTLALNGTSVTVGGTMQSGAVEVVTTVTKEAAGEPLLVLLKPGATFAQASAALAAHHGDLNALNPYGAVVFDAAAAKGTSSAQTRLHAGNYVALDAVSSAANPPHAEFTVTAATTPAVLPTPGATVWAIEFGFRGASTLHDGELVRFQNSGYLVHMIDWIRVKNLATANRVKALLRAGKDNQAGNLASAFGTFAGPLSHGGLQQLVIGEKHGVYVLACFMTTQDGREHTRLGMLRTIRIVK